MAPPEAHGGGDMEYRDNVNLDQSRVRYGGGGRRGGGIAVGGGIGGVLVLLLALFFGGDLGDLIGGTTTTTDSSQSDVSGADCTGEVNIDEKRDCRWGAYEVALTSYWESAFSSGFEPISALQLFSGTTATACGTGTSEMGPFYCPGDTTIYIDEAYMGQLLTQLGTTRSDAAELYIVGHEYGHHISNLTGQMSKANASSKQTGEKSASVRLELQADCYAGVFFANTIKDPDSPIESVTQDDLNRIVDAARAVGDDHIQEQSGGFVNADKWTHGSSQMRQYWVAKGFQSGDPGTCDTFSTDDLGE